MGRFPTRSEALTSHPASTSHLPTYLTSTSQLPAYEPPSAPPPAYTPEPHHTPDPATVHLVGWHRTPDPTLPRAHQAYVEPYVEPSATRTPRSPLTPFDGIIDNVDLEAGRGRAPKSVPAKSRGRVLKKTVTATVRPVPALEQSGNGGTATTTTATTATATAAPVAARTSSSSSNAQCLYIGCLLCLLAFLGGGAYGVHYVFHR